MKTVKIRRVVHYNIPRISVEFDIDPALTEIVRKIEGAKWSRTLNCWHIPDTEETLKNALHEFRDKARLDISEVCTIQKGKKSLENAGIINNNGEETAKPIQRSNYGPVVFTINEADDKLVIRFAGGYDKEWIKEIRSYGWAVFDPVSYEWNLGWTRMKVDSLSDYFSSRGIEVIVKKTGLPDKVIKQREKRGAEIRDRELGTVTLNGIEKVRRFLVEKRYSRNSIEVYVALLGFFFRYFEGKDPAEISEDDISVFFHDYIARNKYSVSYHNQLISALKIFYRLNGLKGFDSSNLGRPRKPRSLPKVFSKEEVKLILNAGGNLKHRLLLWIIYSCGLRRSEVIKIRLDDLDRKRGILNIREAKGMTDRVVPVSDKVWNKVDEYIESYRPRTWLFEGQSGGKYSSESVYRVFKQAMIKAGIRKDVGVHCLRHSYATHLHENGLDIRYIQELLGHKSTRTTEIYTHVSRRNLIAVRSPIEDLDLR